VQSRGSIEGVYAACGVPLRSGRGVFVTVEKVNWLKTRTPSDWLLYLGMAAVLLPTMAAVAHFSWGTEQGAHGPIVVATGIWLLLRQWRSVDATPAPASTTRVLLLFLPLLLLYFLASVTQIIEVQGFVMYGLLLTILYGVVGGRVMQLLAFPLVYLLFAFPPPDTIVALVTQPLKIGLSKAAIGLLYALGYPIAGAGVSIQIGQYQLLVAAACSGLNSLISLSAISLFYVYMRHQANWRYAILLMFAIIPVAIFANFMRILILILLTYHAGESVAQGFLHNFAGLTMFVTALLTIFAIDHLVEPFWRRLMQRSEPSVG
jgi:exosortase